ncbi:MAG: transcriptional regulator, partial [Acidobacteria bacterium]
MPIYEYECSKCGNTIEVIQKFSDKPLEKHDECGGTLTKLISASGFQFKGSGWYVTDYGRKSGEDRTESKDGKKDGKESSTG